MLPNALRELMFHEYPKTKYHIDGHGTVVNDAAEEQLRCAGPDWADSPGAIARLIAERAAAEAQKKRKKK
jgi:hypothetical protein